MSEPKKDGMHPAARVALWLAGTAVEVVVGAVVYTYVERWLGKRLDQRERQRIANLPRVTPVVTGARDRPGGMPDLRPARGGQ